MDTHVTSYNVAVGEYAPPASTKAPVRYETTSSDHGLTGFQDLTPANPQLQARYDAMSPKWEGIKPSNNYVFQNMPKSQAAPAFSK